MLCDQGAEQRHPMPMTSTPVFHWMFFGWWSHCAYLCLRCGLQVTQPIAQPLSSQAELAILLLDAGHALEHHFIILSRQKWTSVCASVHASVDTASVPNSRVHTPTPVHWSGEALVPLRPWKCFVSGHSPPQWYRKQTHKHCVVLIAVSLLLFVFLKWGAFKIRERNCTTTNNDLYNLLHNLYIF